MERRLASATGAMTARPCPHRARFGGSRVLLGTGVDVMPLVAGFG